MSDNLIRCVHENGKVCFLTKAATENRNFMKKYGIRVEHVAKESPRFSKEKETVVKNMEARSVLPEQEIPEIETRNIEAEIIQYITAKPEETNPEAEAEAVEKQVREALKEAINGDLNTKPAKPKATRTRTSKSKKPTKK